MKNQKYMSKNILIKIIIFTFIVFAVITGILGRNYIDNYKYEEVNGKSSGKTYISDFYKDSVVDKSISKLNNKLKANKNKEEVLDVLLKYYIDIVDEHFGDNSGSDYYNKFNNTINISIKSSGISKKKLTESDYEVQNEWNLIISKMANFTRQTKGIINELTSYDMNIQVDVVDINTNEVIATIKNGEISYTFI